MIYLSRLLLNPRHGAVRRDIADCHRLHRAILAAFPAVVTGATGARDQLGVLYRLETNARTPYPLLLLVQSGIQPDWTRLGPGYLLDTAGEPANPVCKQVDEQYAAISAGVILRFRLRANPTKKIDTKSGPDGVRRNGKRVELWKEEDQIQWLHRKGGQHGFEILKVRAGGAIPAVQTGRVDKITGARAALDSTEEAPKTDRLTFGSVQFDGLLRVTDPEALRVALEHGIGSGKAYGFGLLSLARY
jgi:CRISPR system Cascade subunit CasE